MDFEVQSQYRTARELNVTLTLDVNQVKEHLRIITKANNRIIVKTQTKKDLIMIIRSISILNIRIIQIIQIDQPITISREESL